MLLSFKCALSKEMHECVAKFTSEIQLVGERVDHVENKMAEFAGTFNNLVDAHNAREDDRLTKIHETFYYVYTSFKQKEEFMKKLRDSPTISGKSPILF